MQHRPKTPGLGRYLSMTNRPQSRSSAERDLMSRSLYEERTFDLLSSIISDIETLVDKKNSDFDLTKEKLADLVSQSQYHSKIVKDITNQEVSESITIESITKDNIESFLLQNPLILQIFLGEIALPKFYQFFSSLDQSITKDFLYISNSQLNRIAKCFQLMQGLYDYDIISIYERVEVLLKNIFDSKTSYVFIRSALTGRFYSSFDKGKMQIIIKEPNSMIEEASESQFVTIIEDPRNNSHYNDSLDPLFNPNHYPVLLIPIKNSAVLYILYTKQDHLSFSNEDVYIANYIGQILSPFVAYQEYHSIYNPLFKLQSLHFKLEMELLNKNTFFELFEYFDNELKTELKYKEYSLYIIENNEMHTYRVNGNQLFKKKYPISQPYDNVIEIKTFLIAHNGAYFPVLSKDNEVLAILFLVIPLDGLDSDFVTSMCTILTLCIPRCLEHYKKLLNESFILSISKFPSELFRLSLYYFDTSDYIQYLMSVMKHILNAEIFAVLQNGIILFTSENDPKLFFDVLSIKDDVNESDPSRVIGVFDESIHSIIINSKRNVSIIGLNSLSDSGAFSEYMYIPLNAINTLILAITRVVDVLSIINKSSHEFDLLLKSQEMSKMSSQNTEPLLFVFTSLMSFFKCSDFCFFFRKPFSKYFHPVLSSSSGFSPISDIDYQFFDKESPSHSKINSSSNIFKGYEEAISMYIYDSIIMFFGKDIEINDLRILSYLKHYLVVVQNNYFISKNIPYRAEKKEIDSKPNNSLDFIPSASNAIDTIYQIFDSNGFFAILECDFSALSYTIEIIKNDYLQIPYHNWIHAIDSIQFVQVCIDGGIKSLISPIQLLALSLAALCHDIGHNGTPYAEFSTSSPLRYVFGRTSIMENNHLSKSILILRKSLFFNRINDDQFWEVFRVVILATDMLAFKQTILTISNNPTDPVNLAMLVMICANFANVTRTFDYSQQAVSNLIQESKSSSQPSEFINKFFHEYADQAFKLLAYAVPSLSFILDRYLGIKEKWKN